MTHGIPSQLTASPRHHTMAPPGAVAGRMYLCCEHKTKGRNLVPNGLSILDEEGLAMIVSLNSDIRMITKAITPGCTSVDIYKLDLVPEAEKAAFMEKAKREGKGKGGEVPWKEFFGHSWEGHSFDEVLLLVPESAVPKLEEKADVKADEKNR